MFIFYQVLAISFFISIRQQKSSLVLILYRKSTLSFRTYPIVVILLLSVHLEKGYQFLFNTEILIITQLFFLQIAP